MQPVATLCAVCRCGPELAGSEGARVSTALEAEQAVPRRREQSAPLRCDPRDAPYNLKMCPPSMPASALRVSTTKGARRAISP